MSQVWQTWPRLSPEQDYFLLMPYAPEQQPLSPLPRRQIHVSLSNPTCPTLRTAQSCLPEVFRCIISKLSSTFTPLGLYLLCLYQTNPEKQHQFHSKAQLTVTAPWGASLPSSSQHRKLLCLSWGTPSLLGQHDPDKTRANLNAAYHGAS